MGLDMYLTANRYVGGWDHNNTKEKKQYNQICDIMGLNGAKDSPHVTLNLCVAYWRKANAIHGWFIEHCAPGKVDDCRPFHVERSELEELVRLCKESLALAETVDDTVNVGYTFDKDGKKPITQPGKVVTNVKMLADRLPVQSGFFFGGTDYDEFYLDDLRDTVEQLERVLKETAEGDSFEYRASW